MKPDLTTFDAVLLDLDGTVFHEDVALPGAIELIAALQARRQAFAFVSNSGLSPRRLRERLTRMGADVREDQIYTAAAAGCDYVRQHFARGVRVFSVAGDAGHELLDDHVVWVDDDQTPCDVVMSASLANRNATPERFQFALRQILSGAIHVALCADRAYPTPRGFEVGAGAVAAMLSYAADHRPIFCGKPQRLFFESLCSRLHVRPERCVVIGDNLESDVIGARQAGMTSILTLTGIATREHLGALSTDMTPHHVVADLRELV